MIIDTKSNICISEEISFLNDINEGSFTHLCSLEVIESAHYDSDTNSDHIKVEVYITPLDSTNDTPFSSQIHYVNFVPNFYTPSLIIHQLRWCIPIN